MATPLLRLSDGTTTLTFADEANYDRASDNYFVLEDGVRLTPPESLDVYAPSSSRHGAPLVSSSYPNTQIEVLLKIRGDSKPEMERHAAKIEDLLRTAREDALVDRDPRVYLEYQVTGGTTRIAYDVLSGNLALPETVANTFQLANNQMRGAVLTLTCKPFGRGYERALGKAQSAIPREDTDPTTDEGIGIFGDITNVVTNPVFYADVAGYIDYTAAPDEFARYVNIKDSAGIIMPTCVRYRMNLVNEGKVFSQTAGTLQTTWTFSVYLRGRGTVSIGIYSDGGGGSGDTNSSVVLTDAWTRYSVTATIPGGPAPTYVRAGVWDPATANVDCFATKFMLARESFRSPFVPEAEYWAVDQAVPGTSGTGTIYQLAPGHIWDGTAHASTSSRMGVDATATTFVVPTTGLACDKGLTLAFWVKSRSWAWNDSSDRYLFAIGTPGTNAIFCNKFTDNLLYLAVDDAYSQRKQIATAVAFAADTWHHVVATVAANGTIALYIDGTAYASATGTGTGRVEILGTSLVLGSTPSGTSVWVGWIQVQTILSYAATAAQVTALYDAGRDGNKLGYIEANNGANFDGANADANRGTATFTNLNGRIRLRDVQGQVPAPVRIRVYNNTATAYGFFWLGHARYSGIPLVHMYDLTPAAGKSQAAASALGDAYSGVVSLSTNPAAYDRMGSFTWVSDSQQRRYRVLFRGAALTAGKYFTVRLYLSTVFKFFEKRLASQAGDAIYDLGIIAYPPELVHSDSRMTKSVTINLDAGECTSAGEGFQMDWLALIPCDQEVYWDDPRDNRWETDFEPYLAVDTRRDRLLIMSMTDTETTVSGYLDGIKGDVLRMLPGNSHFGILAIQFGSWSWEDTWQIDTIRYAPRYLVPPGF